MTIISVTIDWIAVFKNLGFAIAFVVLFFSMARLITWWNEKRKEKKEKGGKEVVEFGEVSSLVGESINSIKSICFSKLDVMDVPGSLIGKYVEINRTKTSKYLTVTEPLAKGIVLSEYLAQFEKRLLGTKLNIIDQAGNMHAVFIPSGEDGYKYQISRPNCEDMEIHPGPFNVLHDISEFCQNQCIFDCKNCVLSKYGIRKITGKES